MRKVCNEVMSMENPTTPKSIFYPDDTDPPATRSSGMMTDGNRTITLKLKKSEYHIGKESDMAKFWLVDPSVKWELVRFRSIRNIEDRCMVEGILAVRHSPNSQLYRVFHDDDVGVNRSVALYSIDATDRELESNVDANIVYTASSPWGQVTPKTPLAELPPIRLTS